jgi:hypothetical protein
LHAGAAVGARTKRHGRTPLHLAASAGHASVVRALLSAGADVDALDSLNVAPGGEAPAVAAALAAARRAAADARAAASVPPRASRGTWLPAPPLLGALLAGVCASVALDAHTQPQCVARALAALKRRRQRLAPPLPLPRPAVAAPPARRADALVIVAAAAAASPPAARRTAHDDGCDAELAEALRRSLADTHHAAAPSGVAGAASRATPPPPRPRADEDGAMCVVCLDAPPAAALVHGDSAHFIVCAACARRCVNAPCPICRRPVERSLAIYR